MSQSHLRTLAEIAIFSAMAIILDKLPLFTMPQGGSVSLVMLPIVLLALRHGLKVGLLTGAIVGTVQLFFGGYFLNVVQVLLDYVLAYTGIGLAGLFVGSLHHQYSFHKQAVTIALATVLGSCARLLGSFLAGVIFYRDYAPAGTPVWIYSLGYNLSYMAPCALVTAILLIALCKWYPKAFHVW